MIWVIELHLEICWKWHDNVGGVTKFIFSKEWWGMMGWYFFKNENSWMTMVNVEKDDGECWGITMGARKDDDGW